MTRLETYFEDYGSFHRDRRNEATHALGIPMIVLALLMWSSRLTIAAADGIRIDLAMVLVAVAGVIYIALSLPLGLVMTGVLVLLYGLGSGLLGNDPWVALWLFVGGWILQFVGHMFEGRRPAFFRNATHLLVGPIYILSRAIGYRVREPSTKAGS
jgi:uncharacterized membrane protein YGL010W